VRDVKKYLRYVYEYRRWNELLWHGYDTKVVERREGD